VTCDESDSELLRRFVIDDSQEAFAAIVRRHVDLVYSVALRQVRSPELAEEIAQGVFLDLVRASRGSAFREPLAAWLYVVARRAAIDVIRSEVRRRAREAVAVELESMNPPDPDWRQIEPELDEAMAALSAKDRGAVVLRFFENKSLREVGAAIGASEEGARKRIARAIDQLRLQLSRRGIAVGATALSTQISAHAMQSAPSGLSAAICAGTAAGGWGTTAAITFAMTTAQKSLIALLAVAMVGSGFYGSKAIADQERELAALQLDLAARRETEQKIRTDFQALASQAADLAARLVRPTPTAVPTASALQAEVTALMDPPFGVPFNPDLFFSGNGPASFVDLANAALHVREIVLADDALRKDNPWFSLALGRLDAAAKSLGRDMRTDPIRSADRMHAFITEVETAIGRTDGMANNPGQSAASLARTRQVREMLLLIKARAQ
jgi:RNA polymerase sigma factor (sigma-70 family)